MGPLLNVSQRHSRQQLARWKIKAGAAIKGEWLRIMILLITKCVAAPIITEIIPITLLTLTVVTTVEGVVEDMKRSMKQLIAFKTTIVITIICICIEEWRRPRSGQRTETTFSIAHAMVGKQRRITMEVSQSAQQLTIKTWRMLSIPQSGITIKDSSQAEARDPSRLRSIAKGEAVVEIYLHWVAERAVAW